MSVTVDKLVAEVTDFVTAVGDKRAAEARRADTERELDANRDEWSRLDAKKTTQEHEIEQLDAKIDEQREYLAELLAEYTGGPAAGTDPTPAADPAAGDSPF